MFSFDLDETCLWTMMAMTFFCIGVGDRFLDHSLFCPGWEKTEKAMISNEQKTPKKASADDS